MFRPTTAFPTIPIPKITRMTSIMDLLTSPIFWLGWSVFLFWVIGAAIPIWNLSQRHINHRLKDISVDSVDEATPPGVTVIFTARNEATKVEQTLESLLDCRHPALKIIAVDDRSDDETGEILDRIAAQQENIDVLHIDELPCGWLGKCNALHQAAKQATSEYILFTDADVRFSSTIIARTQLWMQQHQVDHLSIYPGMPGGEYWERALLTYFVFLFVCGAPPRRVESHIPDVYVGVGAFNLIRTVVYREFGGHQRIRLDILDDVKIGKLTKAHGHRQAVLLAPDDVKVRWQESAWGIITGLEKNAFASMQYSLAKLSFLTLLFGLLYVLPIGLVITYPDLYTSGHAAAVVTYHLCYARLAIIAGTGLNVLPAMVPSAIALVWAFWRSACITLKQRGVRWRETFYPLAELRRNVY